MEENRNDNGRDNPLNGERITIDSRPVKKRKFFRKPVMIWAAIAAACIVVAVIMNFTGVGQELTAADEAAGIGGDHIGVIVVEGVIGEESSTYDQEYILDSIDGMMENESNKALLLYINTPGGGVYESDEIYLKVKEYQETTKRPVYSYMASQATSGGYYIAAPSDKIIANRNCWTGSIGVISGTFFDVSGFLDEHGIKAENITSGRNKDMGSLTEGFTKEQRQIMQSMVDEAYDQFVGIVADGRDLDEAYVRKIADGRIYTAYQAEDNRLIDEVAATYDDAIDSMKEELNLEQCDVIEFSYEDEFGFIDEFLESITNITKGQNRTDLSTVIELMEENSSMAPQYMCEIVK